MTLLYCTEYWAHPKSPRGSVSGNISFHKMRWNYDAQLSRGGITCCNYAQPCHTKWAERPGRSTIFYLKFCGDVLGVSAHSKILGSTEFIIFSRSYSVFPVLNRYNFFIFFFTGTQKFLHPVGKENIVSKFQRLTRRSTRAQDAATRCDF